ncbi:hypothetical protein ACS5NO_30830 [Larkinella sp. GY13]|uniref:hypothetical protein n=1 Tax=Larkinella sp. GY13 TaxID=3453720 RepID=UPI003EED07EC
MPTTGKSQRPQPVKFDTLQMVAKNVGMLLRKSDSLLTLNDSLNRQNRKLNGDLLKYVAEENFYATALDRQATHYEWLLGILLAAAGLVSYSFINRKFRELQGSFTSEMALNVKNINEKIASMGENIKTISIDHFVQVGYNLSTRAAIDALENNQYYKAIHLFQRAIEAYVKALVINPLDQAIIYKIDQCINITNDILEEILSKPEEEEFKPIISIIADVDFVFLSPENHSVIFNSKSLDLIKKIVELEDYIKKIKSLTPQK